MSITQGLSDFSTSLYAAWTGEVNDDRLFFAAFNGTKWDNQATIPGNSSVGPSLAALNGTLHAAWKGEHGDSDQRLFHASFNGSSWSAQAQIAGAGGSSVGPALGVLDGVLYAVWKGEEGDDRLFWSALKGSTWSGQTEIAGAASFIGPALAAYGGKLWGAWRGSFNDQGLYYASFNGSTWSAQTPIPGVGSSIGPSLAPFGSALYAAWKGEGNDQNLYYASFNGSVWSAQAQIPNVRSSIGPALATFGNKLYAMWKGEGSNQSLYYASFDGTRWSTQATLPGNTGQDMAAEPEGGLMGNSNYMIYSNCNPLKNLAVTIAVTEDIVCGSATYPSGASAPKGLSFQLNGYSPAGARCDYQQYCIGVNMSNSAQTVITGSIDNWPAHLANGSDLINYGVQLLSIPGAALPAGYKITMALGNDAAGNVNSVTFTVVDNLGKVRASNAIELLSLQLDNSLGKPPTTPGFLPGPVTQQDLAPLLAVELNMVGHDSGESAVLTSGAGTITYSASVLLTATDSQPACTAAQGVFTEENANTVYSELPASPSGTLTQAFGVNTRTTQPMVRRVGTPRASNRKP
jgi:hypothetical protein